MKEEFSYFAGTMALHMARTFPALTELSRYSTQLMSKQGVQTVKGTVSLLKSLSRLDQVKYSRDIEWKMAPYKMESSYLFILKEVLCTTHL